MTPRNRQSQDSDSHTPTQIYGAQDYSDHDENVRLREQCLNLEKSLEEKERELKEKVDELEGLKRTFLSNYSQSSTEDVLLALKGINDRVRKMAGNAIDWLETSNYNVPWECPTNSSALAPLDAALSFSLQTALREIGSTASDPTLLLQLAWQAIVTEEVKSALEVFSLSAKVVFNDDGIYALSELWAAIEQGELQAVSSQWRAMTHRYLRTLVPKEKDQAEREKSILKSFRSCQLATGLVLKVCLSDVAYDEKFKPAMVDIMKEVERLADMIREQIATRNYHPWYPLREAFYAGKMDVCEIFATHTRAQDGAMVMCTTRLGLGFTASGGKPMPLLLLKPHVITLPDLEDMKEEAKKVKEETGVDSVTL